MAAKKLSSFEDLGQFAFSTDRDTSYEREEDVIHTPDKQKLEALFSNKGRGGKTVTIIKGFEGQNDDLKALAKKLKAACGVGGSIKDGEIIIQGNYRDKIMSLLKEMGHQVKRVGG